MASMSGWKAPLRNSLGFTVYFYLLRAACVRHLFLREGIAKVFVEGLLFGGGDFLLLACLKKGMKLTNRVYGLAVDAATAGDNAHAFLS